jgi:hypothetical protein
MDVEKLSRGDLVVAARDLTTDGHDVRKGTLGVVFEQAGFYDIDGGAAVRWFNGSAFEVFEGDVEDPENFEYP